jgi:FkbM family methyltransferase
LAFAPASLSHFLETDLLHRQIIHTGFYELALSEWLSSVASKSGGLLVDVGANIGYFTALWLASNPKNTAHCFEPSPRNLKLLGANLAQPPFANRHTVHSIALGKESSTLAFDLGPPDQTGWGGIAHQGAQNTIPVDVRRLDSIFTDPLIEIAVLKIDCEGVDPWVIEGASNLLKRHQVHHVIFEDNPGRASQLGTSTAAAIDLLRCHGYRVAPLVDGIPGEIHAWLP